MKTAIATALVLAPLAGAFTAPSAQKASNTALNAAPKKKKGPAMIKSKSLPFAECPAALDGSMAGDVGFDPLCFSADDSKLFNYREAEIKHAVSANSLFVPVSHEILYVCLATAIAYEFLYATRIRSDLT